MRWWAASGTRSRPDADLGYDTGLAGGIVKPDDTRHRRGLVAARVCGAFLALYLAFAPGPAATQELQVIELHYRLADAVIPTLQPLLEPGGVLTGMDNMLFVRTGPANFEQIRQAVAMLDRKPRQLTISVGQGTVATDSGAGVRGSATVSAGDVRVGVNRPPVGDTAVAVQARQATQRADLRNLSSVTTLEGAETFISVGQSAPVTTTQVAPGWAGASAVTTTEYRDASTGFYATARVNGDAVVLDIAPQQQRLSGPASDRRVETAGLTTRLSGRLGEWMLAGGTTQSSAGSSRGLLTWGRHGSDVRYDVWVKVEEIP
jgi:type II secretory pathway component GspD/PulD (secretin)